MIIGDGFLKKMGLHGNCFRSDMAIYKTILKNKISTLSDLHIHVKNLQKDGLLVDDLTNWILSQNTLTKFNRDNISMIEIIGVDEKDLYYQINDNHELYGHLKYNHGVCSKSYLLTLIEMLETYFREPKIMTQQEFSTIVNSYGNIFARRFFKFNYNSLFMRHQHNDKIVLLNHRSSNFKNLNSLFKINCYTEIGYNTMYNYCDGEKIKYLKNKSCSYKHRKYETDFEITNAKKLELQKYMLEPEHTNTNELHDLIFGETVPH